MQVIVFQLGDENYGLDIEGIREIVESSPLTPVPKAPNWVEGILNHHGTVVTVINPSSFFDLKMQGNALKRVVVLNDPGMDVGFLLEGPMEVISEWETRAEISKDPEFMKSKYIGRVVISKGRVVNILDTERFTGDLDGCFV
jgi:purine-binding chemotaxis protein CheW